MAINTIRKRIRKLEERMSANEAEVARLATVVNETGDELDAIHGEIQAEVDSLQAQINEGKSPKELNLTPLTEAVDKLKPHADSLKGITPDNIPAQTASPSASAGSVDPAAQANAPAAQEAAPTNADGTAVENTTDPNAASSGGTQATP